MRRGKQIHGHSILAQQGVNLIATTVADMGFMWTPTSGSSDAGIDGFIEIRNRETGEATNLIVQAQAKRQDENGKMKQLRDFGFAVTIGIWITG